jgi:hypothetical protein
MRVSGVGVPPPHTTTAGVGAPHAPLLLGVAPHTPLLLGGWWHQQGVGFRRSSFDVHAGVFPSRVPPRACTSNAQEVLAVPLKAQRTDLLGVVGCGGGSEREKEGTCAASTCCCIDARLSGACAHASPRVSPSFSCRKSYFSPVTCRFPPCMSLSACKSTPPPFPTPPTAARLPPFVFFFDFFNTYYYHALNILDSSTWKKEG